MAHASPTFTTATDKTIAQKISFARDRIAYVAPGLGELTAQALVKVIRDAQVSTTVVLDSDADACRIGYSDLPALKALHEVATALHFPIRREPGLRIGLLVADDEVVLWSPTPLAVEAEPQGERRNALVLTGSSVETINTAVAADSSDRLPDEAEIGCEPLTPAELEATIEDLDKNPPAPFDLARKARVLSSRFQFVEFEVRGAEWTGRKIKLSNLLLNADLPEGLQDFLDTHVRPFQATVDVKLEVPLLLDGSPAFSRDGKRLTGLKTQAEVLRNWTELRDKFLRNVIGFGWLIRRDRLERFQEEREAFEEMLTAWVGAFRAHFERNDEEVVESVVSALKGRAGRSSTGKTWTEDALRAEVRAGLERLRVVEPRVRIVLKNVSWESSRDAEFQQALARVIPEKELGNWFEEFTAAPERRDDERG